MPSLHILKGPNEGTTIPLEGDRFVLGRNPDCAIVIPVTSVSREHAVILRVHDQFFIEDLKSRNGTFVNNQAISSRTPLRNNDRIRICDFIAAFRAPESAVTADVVEALRGPEGEEKRELAVVAARDRPLDEECRLIRDLLENNHLLYDRAEANGLHHQLAQAGSRAAAILSAGFHRMVVLDAAWGSSGNAFDLERFLRRAHDEILGAFELQQAMQTYHLENIAQVLKEEPRSLLCFLNVQLVPVAQLRRLRGFTQELHQALFLYQGIRRSEEEEVPDEGDESVEACISGHSQTADFGGERGARLLQAVSAILGAGPWLLQALGEALFTLFPQADRSFLARAAEGGVLTPYLVRARDRWSVETADFSRRLCLRCLEQSRALLCEEVVQSPGDLRIRSLLCVPLWGGDGRALGVLQVDTLDRVKKFTLEDLQFLCLFAAHAALALENTQKFEETLLAQREQQDRLLAAEVHWFLLRQPPPQVPGYELRAGETQDPWSSDCQGFFPLPGGKLAAFVAGVAGKGVPSLLLAASLLADLRCCLLSDPSPSRAVAQLNGLFCERVRGSDHFATLSLAVVDTLSHQAEVVCAGESPPVLCPPGQVVPAEVIGPALGVQEEANQASCLVRLQPGDALVFGGQQGGRLEASRLLCRRLP